MQKSCMKCPDMFTKIDGKNSIPNDFEWDVRSGSTFESSSETRGCSFPCILPCTVDRSWFPAVVQMSPEPPPFAAEMLALL